MKIVKNITQLFFAALFALILLIVYSQFTGPEYPCPRCAMPNKGEVCDSCGFMYAMERDTILGITFSHYDKAQYMEDVRHFRFNQE